MPAPIPDIRDPLEVAQLPANCRAGALAGQLQYKVAHQLAASLAYSRIYQNILGVLENTYTTIIRRIPMAIPKPIPNDFIASLEMKRQKALSNVLNAHEKAITANDEDKELWLSTYARCLSPSIACRQSGISLSRYGNWKKEDPDFCRSMNRCIAHAREDLLGSVMSRATGYVQEDEDGNIITDALGNPIYSGGSDVLAKALLASEMDLPKDSNAQVTVTVNLGALLGGPAAIEGELVKSAIEQDVGGDEGALSPVRFLAIRSRFCRASIGAGGASGLRNHLSNTVPHPATCPLLAHC